MALPYPELTLNKAPVNGSRIPFQGSCARPVRLWDIVHSFGVWELVCVLRSLEWFHTAHRTALESDEFDRQGAAEELQKQIGRAKALCSDSDFSEASRKLDYIQIYVGDGSNYSASTMAVEARHAIEAVITALHDHKFIYIPKTRADFLNNANLLGEKVTRSFPSSVPDIREAGNSLAVDCNTAAVFHLMRVVEWGLRSLAAHLGFKRVKRKVKSSGQVSYVPVAYSEWEKILNEMQGRVDKKIDRLRRGSDKQARQEFYYPALQDIRAIRDAWRNHVMHTRAQYSAEDADAILSHVRRLMNNLAERISEV